jgi:hypothetical protein
VNIVSCTCHNIMAVVKFPLEKGQYQVLLFTQLVMCGFVSIQSAQTKHDKLIIIVTGDENSIFTCL